MEIFQEQLCNCPFCGNTEIHSWHKKKGNGIFWNIWRCRNCLSGFINPRPTSEYMKNLYLTSYQGHTQLLSIEEVLRQEAEYPNATFDANRIISKAKMLINKPEKSLKALDIGSGFGFFTQAAIKLGFKVTAINPGILDNKIFSQINNFQPIAENFEEFSFNNEKYDLIILSQILEHIANPLSMLIKIRKLSYDHSVIAIAVPNMKSFLVKLFNIRENSCFWVPQHLNFFSNQGLSALLTEANLEIIKDHYISRIPYNYFSNRFELYGKTRYMINLLTKIAQIPFMKIIDRAGWGIYYNLWVRPKS